MPDNTKIRLQIDAPPAMVRTLDDLKTRGWGGTRTSVMKNALSLYKCVVDAAEEGSVLVLMRPSDGHATRILIPEG